MDKEQLLADLKAAYESRDYATLEKLAQQAVEEFPEEAFGYYYLAEYFTTEEKVDYFNVETCLAKAIELDEDSLGYMVRFAQIKEQQGAFEDAAILWGKILRQDENNIDALIGKATIELRQYKNYEGALDFLNRAIKIDDSNHQLYILRGQVYNGLHQFDKALADVEKGLEGGFDEKGLVLKIALLRQEKRLDEVIETYKKIIAEKPEVFVYRFNFGKEYYNQEKYAEAAEQLKKATELVEEEDAMLYQPLGRAYLETEQYEAAKEALQKAIALDEEEGHEANSTTYMYLVDAFIGLEDGKNALATIEKLNPLISGNKRKQNMVNLKKGVALGLTGKLKEAEAILKPVAEKPGLRQGDASYSLGLIDYKEGDLANAYKHMKTARRLRNKRADVFIQNNLLDYLQKMQKEVLDNYSSEFEKNAQSPWVQKVSGKLWHFTKVDSQKLKDLPDNIKANINKSIQKGSMIFTEKGALMVSEKNNANLTYKIKKEKGNAVILEFAPLDNQPAFAVQLKLKNGKLAFSKEKGETLILEEKETSSMPEEAVETFQQFVEKDEVAYLGNDAQPIVDAMLQ